MGKVQFVSSWRNFNERTWSGTPYGIFKSLSDKVDVDFVDIAPQSHKGIIQKIVNIYSLFNAQLRRLKYGTRLLNEKGIIVNNIPSIVFFEYNCKNIESLYCYQDLSIDFLLRSGRIESKFLGRLSKKNHEKRNKIAIQFYRKCAGIFTMSEWLKKDLVEQTKISPEKIHVVGGGCNIDVSKVDYSQKNGDKFLFVGSNWERKNGDLVVKAFELLRRTNPNVYLYIAGPKTCPRIVRGKENVHYLGRLSSNELHSYFNLCDYFVMPSKFEAYGLVFAEALSFGLPCIGKNCFAMPEFIKDCENGYLIQDSNENELVHAMSEMLKNGPEMSVNIRKKREEYVKKYSWDSVAERIITVLKKDGYDL